MTQATQSVHLSSWKSVSALQQSSHSFPLTLQLVMSSPSDFILTDDINVVGIVLGVLVVIVVLLCITAGICCAYKKGFFSSQKQTGNR